MIAKTGLSIPIRDMRLLDFNLAQNDSTILVRDNAIIASLEHARVIIMADKAIIPRQTEEQNPLASRFLDVLEESIAEWIKHKQEFERHMENSESTGGYEGYDYGNKNSLLGFDGHKDHEDASSVSTLQQDLQPLPFELVVLESALKEVIASIGHLNTEIEGIITHALDSLLKSISPNNLERVRKVKTRLQRLSLRCEGLRDELQRFLHDDDDMAKMCLTRRKEIEDEVVKAASQSVESEMPERQSMPLGSFRRSYLSRHSQLFASSGASPVQMSAAQGPGGLSASLAQEEDAEADSEAQMEVENLLESYYMEVDAMYDKLVSIEEYIKDTEEYINIELDSSRNRLIRMDIILSVATFAIMPFNLLAGILGENLVIPQQITKSVSEFFGVNAIAAAVCLIVFYSLMLYMKLTKLI
jgi:magnesium transporter